MNQQLIDELEDMILEFYSKENNTVKDANAIIDKLIEAEDIETRKKASFFLGALLKGSSFKDLILSSDSQHKWIKWAVKNKDLIRGVESYSLTDVEIFNGVKEIIGKLNLKII